MKTHAQVVKMIVNEKENLSDTRCALLKCLLNYELYMLYVKVYNGVHVFSLLFMSVTWDSADASAFVKSILLN